MAATTTALTSEIYRNLLAFSADQSASPAAKTALGFRQHQVAVMKAAPPKGKTPDDVSEVEQRAAIRAMLISMPADICTALPAPLMDQQEQLLHTELAATGGPLDATTLPGATAAYPEISVWQGDMTKLQCDVHVNPANGDLLGCFLPSHKCLDNILHAQSGPRLRIACQQQKLVEGIDETPNGKCMVTPAFALPAKFVFHTVGPCLLSNNRKLPPRAPTPVDREELHGCYQSCLDAMDANGCTSIAFCCISTGIFAYPADEAAVIALRAVKEWVDKRRADGKPMPKVVFNTFLDSDKALYDEIAPEVLKE